MNILRRGLAAALTVVLSGSLLATTQSHATVEGGCVPLNTASMGLEIAPEFRPFPAGMREVPSVSAGYHRIWDMATAWNDLQPVPGWWDPTNLRNRITQAQASPGKPRILYVMGLTPEWAAKDPSLGDPRWGVGSASPPASIKYWTDYVTRLVAEFGDDIDAYEIWNEANLQTFWQGDAEEMALMTRVAYNIIKQYDPTAVVLSPSTTLRLRTSAYNWNQKFIPALLAYDEVPVDAYAVHSYPAGDFTAVRDAVNARAADVQFYRATMRDLLRTRKGEAKKPLWDTELNYGLKGPGDRPGYNWGPVSSQVLMYNSYYGSQYLGIESTFWYLYTKEPFDLLGVQFYEGNDAPFEMNQSWVTLWNELAAAEQPCSDEAREDLQRRSLLAADAESYAPQPQDLEITGAERMRGNRLDPNARQVRINVSTAGFAEGYPLKVQIKRGNQINWQTLRGRPRIDANGDMTHTINSRGAVRIRVITESGNNKSNVARVRALQ